MGILSNELLLEKGLRAAFLKSFESQESPADIMGMVMTASSTANEEKYGWLGEVPQLREWLDERQLSGLQDFDFTIPNRDYESTLKVDRNTRDDDQLGAINIRISDLAKRAKTHPRKLFFDLILAGEVDLAYDGVPFFSASHPESGVNQSNIVTGTSGGPYTTAQFAADFTTARARLRGFTDDQGEPINDGSDLNMRVVIPEQLETVADEILEATLISNNTNVLKGAAKKTVSSRLDSSDDWYLAVEMGGVRATIMQTRQPVRFEALEKGERAFMRKHLLFGVDYRVGFGFGRWQKMIKINN